MQAMNRIQNAMTNANAAAMQGAMVVVSANAHRAYLSFKPCDLKPVSKCPEKSSTTRVTPTVVQTTRRPVQVPRGSLRLTSGSIGQGWRLESYHSQMPASLWATFVLNRQLCG